MGKVDYQKAALREAARRPSPFFGSAKRKAKTGDVQRAKIAAMCSELGREPTFPKMAYDANLEIDRLQRLLDTRRRMAGS